MANDSAFKNADGFISTQNITKEMQRYGFIINQIDNCLRRLTNKKLIETTERITFEEGLESLEGDLPLIFRTTTVGTYHVKRWMPTFAYIDAMLFDTPIVDAKIRSDIASRLDSFDIHDRYNRTLKFVEYLDEAWQCLEVKPVYFDWLSLKSLGKSTFDSVHNFIRNKI